MKTLKEYAMMVEAHLETILPKMAEGEYEIGSLPWLLSDSMRYSLLAGGKRLRPSMRWPAWICWAGISRRRLIMPVPSR